MNPAFKVILIGVSRNPEWTVDNPKCSLISDDIRFMQVFTGIVFILSQF